MIRFSAGASTTIPAIEPSSSAKYSPWPGLAHRARAQRQEHGHDPGDEHEHAMPSESVSTASAPSTIGLGSPGSQFQIVRPIAATERGRRQQRHQHALHEARRGTGRPSARSIEPPTEREQRRERLVVDVGRVDVGEEMVMARLTETGRDVTARCRRSPDRRGLGRPSLRSVRSVTKFG